MDIGTLGLSVVLGVSTGVVASLLAWWILFRRLVPDLTLSDSLNYYLNEGDTTARSQVRLEVGSRAIVELRVSVSVRIPDLVREGSTELLSLFRRESDYLPAGKVTRYRIRLDAMVEETFRRFRPYLGPGVVEGIAEQRPVDLKVLFREHPNAEIGVTAIARDAVTGASGVTQEWYGADSLTEGRGW